MITHECSICSTAMAASELRCTHCGALYTSVPATVPYAEARRTAERELGVVVDGDEAPMLTRGGAKRLYDFADVPVERLVTEIECVDLVTGGGYAIGKAYAIHGPGGCGKSRIALASAAALCSVGAVVYASASAEEDAESTRRHAKDAGYFDRRCVRDNLLAFDREDDPESLIRRLVDIEPVFAVVDASSALDDERYAARLLRALSHDTDATILSVFHETVDGKMSGGHKLPYLVDAVLDMDVVARTKKGGWKGTDVSPYKRIRSGKNRFGKSGTYAILELTECGFSEIELCDGTTREARGKNDGEEDAAE